MVLSHEGCCFHRLPIGSFSLSREDSFYRSIGLLHIEHAV